jgi:lipopolysaccharide heptosyltransferase II
MSSRPSSARRSLDEGARLLIRAPNWLGDAVMALPALESIRTALPSTHITIAAIESVAPMFREETSAAPDAVLAIPDRRREARLLAAGGFDAVLLLPNSFRSAWTAHRAGIRERWGVAANMRRPLLTRAVDRPRGRVHQSEYYLAVVRALGFEATDSLPRIAARPDTIARAGTLLARSGVGEATRIVGFAPGAAYGHAKRWPPSRVADVIARLSRDQLAACVLLGAADDRDAGREIESALPPGVVINLIGRTDLSQLTGVLARCAAFVSNDSGAMHLAAALGVPVTAIFGPTDQRVTSPLGKHDVLVHDVFCRPCMLRDCPIDHRCMKGISADAVFASLSARLHG